MSFENKGSMAVKAVVSAEPDRSGNYVCDGTSDEDEINQAINDLTTGRDWIEQVVLKGDFVIDGPIITPAYTHLINTGLVTLANGSNCNMLENATPAGADVEVIWQGGLWDGNYHNQTAGDIWHWESSIPVATNERKWIQFIDARLIAFYDSGLFVDCDGASDTNIHVNNVRCRLGNTGVGAGWSFYFYRVSDGWMNNCQSSGGQNGGGMCFYRGGIWHVANTYSNQLFYIRRVSQGKFINTHVDLGTDQDAIWLHGATDCQLIDTTVRMTGSSGFVGNAALYVSADGGNFCARNEVINFKAGRAGGAGTNRFNFIIEEDATNVYDNTYKNIFPEDYVTAVADLQGLRQKMDFISWALKPKPAAVNAAYGVEVNAAGEAAVTAGILPPSVHEVVFIVIDAFTAGGSGAQEMEIELNVDGGAGNQPWNTHSTTQANLDSEETGVAANDNLTWVVNSRDYANIRALTAGDRVLISVDHEVGIDGDADTNGQFGSATLYYV